MRYPYELLLAGVAGLLEFIPVFGPAAALVIMLIVCAVSGSGGLIWIVVFWGCYRVFQDYVLNPYLMSVEGRIAPAAGAFWSSGRQQHRWRSGNVFLHTGNRHSKSDLRTPENRLQA